MNHVQLLVDLAPVAGKIGVDEVNDELSRVHVERNGETAGVEVRLHLRDGTAVCGATLRKQKQLVEHGESRGRRLVNGRDDDQVVLLGDVLDERDDLEGCGRVETRSGLVKEEQLRAGDELRSDTDTTLLTTGNTLSDGSTDQVVGLALKTESSQERLNALDALELADVLGERQARGEVEGLTDSERADKGILLLDVGGDATESLGVCW